jgi:hypothetical protein
MTCVIVNYCRAVDHNRNINYIFSDFEIMWKEICHQIKCLLLHVIPLYKDKSTGTILCYFAVKYIMLSLVKNMCYASSIENHVFTYDCLQIMLLKLN